MTTQPSHPMSDDVQALFEAATTAMGRAYAPYSDFPVGAAIRSTSGAIYAGCNVENAAYPQGWCGETSAIAAMVSAGEREIAEVLVVSLAEGIATCCGGCRQKLREFAPLDTLIHVCGPEGVRAIFTLDELLPLSFGPEQLAGR
ncbi:MAG: cytidine deaminase [Ilumatobacteraceae bacterium]